MCNCKSLDIEDYVQLASRCLKHTTLQCFESEMVHQRAPIFTQSSRHLTADHSIQTCRKLSSCNWSIHSINIQAVNTTEPAVLWFYCHTVRGLQNKTHCRNNWSYNTWPWSATIL